MVYKNQKTSNLNQTIIQIVKDERPKTVKQLVELVHQQNPLPQQQIVDQILYLQNQGKITLKEDKSSIPSSLQSYIFYSHSYWYWIIITLALATTTMVLTVSENLIPFVYARYIIGAIFVVYLPGYSLIRALFSEKEMDNIERTALSIGMSLALVPIIVLILNYTPWGIRIAPLTLSLLALTSIFATAAIMKEHQNKTSKTP
jgi:hypothetical protein